MTQNLAAGLGNGTTERMSGSGASMTMIGALYVAQGIPLGFAFEALPVSLRSEGIPLEMLAWLPLSGVPWVIKLLWAPYVDAHWISRWGRRRTWILSMQFLLAVSMAVLAMLPVGEETMPLIALVMTLGIVAAATQDIATDGLAAETQKGSALAVVNALQIGGMLAGFMAGGSGVLLLSDLVGFRSSIFGLAALLLLILVPALLWREGEADSSRTERVSASVISCFRRPGSWPLLSVCATYGTLYAGTMALSKLMLTDYGWSLSAVGIIAMLTSAGMILVGCPLGSWLAGRVGLWRTMTVGSLLVGLAILAWILTAWQSNAGGMAEPVVGALLLGIGGGIASVGAMSQVMKFAGAGGQAGTDATALQSGHVFGEIVASSVAVGLASAYGYEAALYIGAGGLVVILGVLRWASGRKSTKPYASLVEGPSC